MKRETEDEQNKVMVWRTLIQGEQKESVLKSDKTHVGNRLFAMHGEERESMLEHDRVLVSERRARVKSSAGFLHALLSMDCWTSTSTQVLLGVNLALLSHGMLNLNL